MNTKAATARRAASTLGWSSFGTAAMFVTNAVALIVLSRVLDPEVFGVLAVANTIGIILRGIGPWSVTQAMIADGASDRAMREGTTLSWVASAAMGLGLVVLATPIADLFGVPGNDWIFRAWALVLMAQGMSAAPVAELQHHLDFKKLSIVQLGATVVGSGVVPIAMALAGFGLVALYAGYLTLAVLELVGVTILVGHLRRPTRSPLGRMARETSVFSVTMATSTIATNGDNLVVGATLGGETLGLYSRAYRLMSMPAIIVGDAVDTALFPIIRRSRTEVDLLTRGVDAANALLALVLLPVSAMAYATAAVLVPTLLGTQWVDAVPIFEVLCAGMFFRVGSKPFAALLRGSGHQHRLAVLTTVNAVLVVIGSLVGSIWDARGVAAGVVISLVLNYLITVVVAMRSIDRSTVRRLVKVAAAIPVAIVSGVVAAQYDRLPSSWPDLLAVAVACAVAGLPILAALAVPPFRRVTVTLLKLRSKAV